MTEKISDGQLFTLSPPHIDEELKEKFICVSIMAQNIYILKEELSQNQIRPLEIQKKIQPSSLDPL